ncbi:MAG: hypothetical protein AAF830_13930 [Pseudomonadota bacterium]
MSIGLITELEENAASIVRDRRQRGLLDAHNRERLQKRSRDQREERSEQDEAEVASALISQAAQQSSQLVLQRFEQFDAALMQQLMDNQRLLDMLGERLATMRENAVRLNDGRLGFDDGAGGYVDETGRQITPDELIDAEMPERGNAVTRYDEYSEARDQYEALEAEQEQLRSLQERSDDIKDQLRNGEITADEAQTALDGLERDLNAIKPDVSPELEQSFDQKRAFINQASVPTLG